MRGAAARAFAIIAALLWRVAGWGGASASGPANGKDGVIAFDLIARAEPDRRREAVALLMRMRNEVSGHADAAEVSQTLWRATEGGGGQRVLAQEPRTSVRCGYVCSRCNVTTRSC
jgi:hypothetical protein